MRLAENRSDTVYRTLDRAAALVVLLLYLWHLSLVWATAVDIPYRDGWQLVERGLDEPLSLAYLFHQHNEHRIATTKLLVWLLYHTTAWDVRTHLVLNFVFFGCVILTLRLFWNGSSAIKPRWFWLLLCPVLSLLNWENHSWGFQTQFHFFLLGTLLGALLLFDARQRWLQVVAGCAAAVFALCSFSAGAAAAAGLGCVYVLFKLRRIRGGGVRREWGQLVFAGAVLLGTAAVWIGSFEKPSWQPPLVLPHRIEFWSFFGNLVSLGFGVEAYAHLPAAAAGIIVFVPALWLLWTTRGEADNCWQSAAAIVAIGAALAAVAVGRAGNPDPHIWSKGSRYHEIAVLLVPLSAIAWGHVLAARARAQAVVSFGIVLYCGIAYYNNWDSSVYWWIRAQKLDGLACAARYYENAAGTQGDDYRCNTVWGDPISERLAAAKKLELSFVRKLRSGARPPS